uniref:Large ribosomal subunit protein uL13c n=1 Tax=Ophidocladus simpliciusculus TaxID=1261574 RepID=A0A1Z1MJ25_9FLOR|nr:ribosomal protein L13 [Ophidocladus simpliciusculus]ARW66053.1 ribosomal protein L13 [Ophidocladus simpliciusculus]
MKIDKNKTTGAIKDTKLDWYIIDATDSNLGRLSSKIVYLLMGKNNINYLPHNNTNISIIIINSKKIKVTGKKNKQKTYKRHSGRPGGLKIKPFNKLQEKQPNKIIEHAIKGMLPKNTLGKKIFKKLKVYSGNEHPHQSQKPVYLNIK